MSNLDFFPSHFGTLWASLSCLLCNTSLPKKIFEKGVGVGHEIIEHYYFIVKGGE
jgi:hypothetical protein